MARDLRKLGFKDVRILKGGLGAWTNAGLPIETRSDISAVGLELYKALAGGNARGRAGNESGEARSRASPKHPPETPNGVWGPLRHAGPRRATGGGLKSPSSGSWVFLATRASASPSRRASPRWPRCVSLAASTGYEQPVVVLQVMHATRDIPVIGGERCTCALPAAC